MRTDHHNLTPGTLISAPIVAGIRYPRHYAIVSDRVDSNLRPFVISNSKTWGRVVEENIARAFCEGSEIRVDRYVTPYAGQYVVRRARGQIGQPYKLLHWNCEHFVKHCYGENPTSEQVAWGVILGLVGILLLASK